MKNGSSGKMERKEERSKIILRFQKWEGGRKALSVIKMSKWKEKAGQGRRLKIWLWICWLCFLWNTLHTAGADNVEPNAQWAAGCIRLRIKKVELVTEDSQFPLWRWWVNPERSQIQNKCGGCVCVGLNGKGYAHFLKSCTNALINHLSYRKLRDNFQVFSIGVLLFSSVWINTLSERCSVAGFLTLKGPGKFNGIQLFNL